MTAVIGVELFVITVQVLHKWVQVVNNHGTMRGSVYLSWLFIYFSDI